MTRPAAAPDRIQRKIRELAREYRDSGYRVLIDPAGADIPPFLSGFHPDLIALGEPESVVIEVKSGSELPESRQLADLAARVSQQPGWRLDLVVSNPRDRGRLESAAPWDPSDIARHLSESLAIGESGHKEAAFLLLWASTEALLRHLARREKLDSAEVQPPRQIINELAAADALDRRDYLPLLKAADIRNRIAHGISPSVVEPRLLELLGSISERLLSDLHRAA